MNYKDFEQIIESLEKIRERTHNIYTLGIDLMEYEEIYHTVISKLISSVFTEEGVDWINWYLYERISYDGKILNAFDENNNEICQNVQSLWDTVKQHRKQ